MSGASLRRRSGLRGGQHEEWWVRMLLLSAPRATDVGAPGLLGYDER
ncbi:hypothetical protein QW131_33810 [Roseibium salinum]|nr:hypothetical protein [Roseibium salinum]